MSSEIETGSLDSGPKIFVKFEIVKYNLVVQALGPNVLLVVWVVAIFFPET